MYRRGDKLINLLLETVARTSVFMACFICLCFICTVLYIRFNITIVSSEEISALVESAENLHRTFVSFAMVGGFDLLLIYWRYKENG